MLIAVGEGSWGQKAREVGKCWEGMSDGGAAEGWGDRDGSISPEAKPLLRVRGWSGSVCLAGWQKGFSVWWQSGRQPQRDNLIPHEEQNCGSIPLRFTTPAPLRSLSFFNPLVSYLHWVSDDPSSPLALPPVLSFFWSRSNRFAHVTSLTFSLRKKLFVLQRRRHDSLCL